MEGLIDWLPWLAVAVIPGVLNVFAAFEELEERCKLLPFFEPLRNPGVWLWGVIQFSFPTAIFWMVAALSTQPVVNLELIGMAIGFGVGFIAVLNASTQIGSRTYTIKPIYTFFIDRAYGLIAAKQDDRVFEFWTDVETELQKSPDLTEGLSILENYFAFQESLTRQPIENYGKDLNEIRSMTDRAEQARGIKVLLQRVRRERLFRILRRFQVSETLLIRYFPRQFGDRPPRRKR